MGQRMQVVFQIENDKEGRTNVAYHLQWGIGRITPFFIMQALIRADQMTHNSPVVNVFNHAETGDAVLCNDVNEYNGFTKQLQKYDFRDLTQAGEWFEHQDNNNGGAIVYVETKYDEWGVEEIEFEDDKDDDEEKSYQMQAERDRAQIDLMRKVQRLHREQLCEMIRGELHRGHNLQSDFDPYPGWDSHHLCGYEIEQKDIKVIESHEVNDDVLCIAFYQDGYEDIIIPLIADFVPIEVLLNIYASMK